MSPFRLEVEAAVEDAPPASKHLVSMYTRATLIVRVQCQPNQRTGTDRHTEPGYLPTGSRPGHAAPDAGAAVLLLPLIEVAPACSVNALEAGAIPKCAAVTLDVRTNRHTR